MMIVWGICCRKRVDKICRTRSKGSDRSKERYCLSSVQMETRFTRLFDSAILKEGEWGLPAGF